MSDEMDGRLLDPTSPMSRAVQMPNLRKLAGAGTNFVRSICNNPQCVPSRTSMFTGRHTHNQRAGWNNGQGLAHSTRDGSLDHKCVEYWSEQYCLAWKHQSPVNVTLDQAMELAGFNVTMFGKIDVGANLLDYFPSTNSDGFHNGPNTKILTRSADIRKATQPLPLSITNTSKPLGPFPGDWKVSQHAVDFLDNYDAATSGGPFFLYSSIIIPHPPFFTNETWLKRVNETFMEQDELGVPVWDPEDSMHPYDSYMSQSKNVFGTYNRTAMQYPRRAYFAMNAMADYLHGQVLDALDRNGLTNNTLVMFVADHGEMAMTARQIWKESHREPSLRVPMIIAGPGIPKGHVVRNATSLVDVFPTLLEWAGAVPPDWMDGYSLMDLLREQGIAGGQWSAEPTGTGTGFLTGVESEDRAIAATPTRTAEAEASELQNKLGGFAARSAGKRTRPPYVLSQYSSSMGNDGAFCLYQPPYKLIDFGHALPWFNESAYTPQLFNVEEDPWEHHDLAAEKPEVVSRMRADLATLIDVQAEDRARKISDRYLFEKFIVGRVGDGGKLKQYMKGQYHGFDEPDWGLLQRWRHATL